MSDYARLAVAFLAAVNPAWAGLAAVGRAGALPGRERAIAAAVGLATGVAVVAAAAFGAGRFLDFLEIEPESFRFAAGMVMAALGVAALWRRRPDADEETATGWRWGLYPLGIPLLAGPASLAAAISYGADEGAGLAFGAALPAVALGAVVAAIAPSRLRGAFTALAPVIAAALVAIGVGLMVSGVRDI